MVDNVVSYETFRKYQRLEQENDALQPLPEDFYRSFAEWLERKEDIFRKTKEPIIEREITNAKKILEEIIERRQKKILLLADHSSRSDMVPKNMLSGELDCFGSISHILKKFKSEILDFKPQTTAGEAPPVTEKKETRQGIREGYDLVRMLDNLESFAWSDGVVYGPLNVGDLVTLPSEIAKMLSGREKVEILNPQL